MSDHSSYDNVPKSEQPPLLLPITLNCNPATNRVNNITTNAPVVGGDKELTPGRCNLQNWLGHTFRVVITDGRVLVGFFNCTDKDANVVLSMCAEYLEEGKDARILGNVMIPGKHIVSIAVDMPRAAALSDKPNAASAPDVL
ncbi:PREDICTED: N-alpha-acetyltransferase 38-A, NatC auxiliary subunit [Rhagoletis zephyria]|uniref:N-alpha-acetyltransferase 38-A, NatC auxiliary subunit n=1 Tax=Rhagoletis zephyria TaxID=28612 RepID=UPI0008118961|nr:PREDICTED: N-alpha-acetyltransferase 38-A, NatC auxiliary subunit [Rhagoletis zephyria]XP_036338971.1 N-alpha-acetyltransferase 38-A, NatC auxiliary subunit [Rhagoletis pomonella]